MKYNVIFLIESNSAIVPTILWETEIIYFGK